MFTSTASIRNRAIDPGLVTRASGSYDSSESRAGYALNGVPIRANAVVEPMKVRDYLLSRTHPIGTHNASFVESLGYTWRAWEILAAELARVGWRGTATVERQTGYGQLYTVDDTIVGPSGRQAPVRTVWIIRDGEDRPRLITAYPGDDQ